MTVTAQYLYDLRDITAFVSGTDLHSAFAELCGEPSPSGEMEINIPDDHWLALAIVEFAFP